MSTALVTGANRGLGLELVRQYAGDGWRVLACCREPAAARELSELAGGHDAVTLHALDVEDVAAVDALAASLSAEAIDVLINNAGQYSVVAGNRESRGQELGDMDYAAWQRMLRVNTLAPFKLAEAFLEHVARSEQRKIVTISSGMGSIASTSGSFHAYRSSKAAVNMVMATLAHELAPRGIRIGLYSPGWVRTRMGGSSAPLGAEESVRGLRARIAELDAARSGRFLRWDGSEVSW